MPTTTLAQEADAILTAQTHWLALEAEELGDHEPDDIGAYTLAAAVARTMAQKMRDRDLNAAQMIAKHYPEAIRDLDIYPLTTRQHALAKALDSIASWYAKPPADTISLLFAWRLRRIADNAEFLDAENLRDYQIGEAAYRAADAQFRREIARATAL